MAQTLIDVIGARLSPDVSETRRSFVFFYSSLLLSSLIVRSECEDLSIVRL
jgi:hypothetical protein